MDDLDLDTVDDLTVFNECRGISRMRDEGILRSILAKLGGEAFSDEALRMMAEEYRAYDRADRRVREHTIRILERVRAGGPLVLR